MTALRSWIGTAVGLFFPLMAWAGGQTSADVDTAAQLRDDYIRASLLVAEPSCEVYSLFGHCALRLECPSAQMDYSFSFETSADTRGLIRFVRGASMGGFMAARTDRYLDAYRKAGRGVAEYELNLDPKEKLRLWQIVDEELAKGFSRHYDYLHTHCTSMIVALVQQASREPIVYSDVPAALQGSFRNVLLTTSRHPWSTFFWQTVMGPAADATGPLKDKFVPVLLPQVWKRAGVIRGESPFGVESVRVSTAASLFSPTLVFSCLLLAAVGLTLVQRLRGGWRRVAGLVDGTLLALHLVAGLALLWLVVCSRLEGTQWNWYLLAFNPVPEVAGVLTQRWLLVCRCTLGLLLTALLLTPFVAQLDLPHALLTGIFAVRLAARLYTTHNTHNYIRITQKNGNHE